MKMDMFNLKEGNVVMVKNPTINEDIGGMTWMKGVFQAKITASYLHDVDIECPPMLRYNGELIKEEDISISKSFGTSKLTFEDHSKYGDKWVEHIKANMKKYDPKVINFSPCDIIQVIV